MMLDRSECQVLRGLAIFSIFMHNFCHLLKWAAHENEFSFLSENVVCFWDSLHSKYFIVHLFSYLGHLGVPVFVFLTGYGLAIKYSNPHHPATGGLSFLTAHYKKLFFPMLFGVVIFYLVYYLLHAGFWDGWKVSLITQLTMTGNFMSHPNIVIIPGPYWYFGLTMQLYVIYRLVVCRSKWAFLSLVVLSIAILGIQESHVYRLMWLKYNSIGWLIPFSIGLVLGKKQIHFSLSLPVWLMGAMGSAALVFWSGNNYYTWLITPLFALLFFVCLCKLLKGFVYRGFEFLGGISMYVFIVHPIVREVILTWSPFGLLSLNLLLYIVAVILLAWLSARCALLLKHK